MSNQDERPSKRRKTAHESTPNGIISNASQISQLLEFRQSTDEAVSTNLEIFKSHLLKVAQLQDGSPEKSQQLQILLEYSQWQKAATETQLDFHDLLSTWSFAVEQNTNDAILSLVPNILAQFLKTISGSLDLRQYGLALIDNLLRRDQSKLFGKSFAAARSKPHLSASCLSLLTEMVAFDGGTRAQEIWLRRDLFINRDALLSTKSAEKTEDQNLNPHPLRPLTITLFLTLMKYLDATAKADFLLQGKAFHALLQGVIGDSSQDILNTLDMIEKCLIDDRDVQRPLLQRFFNSVHLEYLAALYNYQLETEEDDQRDTVREAVHKLLRKLCTTRNGILLHQDDWYTLVNMTSYSQHPEDDYIDIGMDSLLFNGDYTNSVPVKNVTLSNFLQKLKPFQDVLQSSLLVDILKAAPELVADYFSRRKQIPPPNSEDPSWRGAIVLLFSIIETPIPLERLDMSLPNPPPPTIVVESIIPRPLDRSYFHKLLSSEDDTLKITGARLLTTLLRKLKQVLSVSTSVNGPKKHLWDQAKRKLLELIQARVPPIRDIALTVQHTVSSDVDLSTVILECFAVYLKVLSGSAAMTTFDITPVMTQLCSQASDTQLEMNLKENINLQIGYCIEIAELTSATRWLQKSDADTLSPLGQLIKVCFAERSSAGFDTAIQAIKQILCHHGILSSPRACLALFSSLRPTKKLHHFSPIDELFLFLDNSIVKANQKPVKYLDVIENAQQLLSDKKISSLLVASMSEQWGFAIKKYESDKKVMKNLALFTAQLFSNLEKVGENFRVMQHLKRDFQSNCGEKIQTYIEDAFLKVGKLSVPTTFDKELLEFESSGNPLPQEPTKEHQKYTPTLDEFRMPPYRLILVPRSLEELRKWSASTDFEVEIASNQLSRLIFALSASEEELRLQSLQLVQKVTHLIDTTSTNFDAKPQVFLLLSEVLETIKVTGLNEPLPTIVPQLAHQILRLLLQPEDKMYPKVNRFLLAAPTWDVKRLIKYWADKILLRPTGADDPGEDAWSVEVNWLLKWLASSIRTEQDLELYRRSGIWERIMSLYASPAVGVNIRKMIIVMLWRVCEIHGGADTLWTRFGVHSCLQQMLAVDTENEAMLRALKADMEKLCNQTATESWKVGCALLGRDAITVH